MEKLILEVKGGPKSTVYMLLSSGLVMPILSSSSCRYAGTVSTNVGKETGKAPTVTPSMPTATVQPMPTPTATVQPAANIMSLQTSAETSGPVGDSQNPDGKRAKKLIIKKASVKTKTIKCLKKNKKYYIRIRAYMKKGRGDWSTISKRTKS